MSLYGTINVNEKQIACWKIQRLRPVEVTEGTVCTYRCTYISTDGPLQLLTEPAVFELEHRYGDGGTKLVASMLARVSELEEAGR